MRPHAVRRQREREKASDLTKVPGPTGSHPRLSSRCIAFPVTAMLVHISLIMPSLSLDTCHQPLCHSTLLGDCHYDGVHRALQMVGAVRRQALVAGSYMRVVRGSRPAGVHTRATRPRASGPLGRPRRSCSPSHQSSMERLARDIAEGPVAGFHRDLEFETVRHAHGYRDHSLASTGAREERSSQLLS